MAPRLLVPRASDTASAKYEAREPEKRLKYQHSVPFPELDVLELQWTLTNTSGFADSA